MNYNYVFWDWNGTILNDLMPSLCAINDMLKRRGKGMITVDEYKKQIDTPIIKFYNHFFDMENEDFKFLSSEYHALYENYLHSATLTKGIVDVLKTLQNNEVSQIIASSSNTIQIEKFIDFFAIRGYFTDIIGADDYRATSKIDRISNYFQTKSIIPQKALFIGDTPHDFEAANAVGADCILVSFGHKAKCDLILTKCRVIDNIKDVLHFL